MITHRGKAAVTVLILVLLFSGVTRAQLQHFQPVDTTGNVYQVQFRGVVFGTDTLTPGDEIAVFDGPLCVGAKVSPDTAAGNRDSVLISVACWMQTGNPGEPWYTPGAVPGHTMSFRVWDSETNSEFSVYPANFVHGNGTFGNDNWATIDQVTTNTTEVTFQTVPPLLDFSLDGITYTTDASGKKIHICNRDSLYTVSIDSIQDSGVEGMRYRFNSWSDHQPRTHSFTATGPTFTLTATCSTQYLVTLNTAHGTASGTGWHNAGEDVDFSIDSLIVSGGTGRRWTFQGWTGTDTTGTDSAYTITAIDTSVTETAQWQKQFNLITQENPDAGGDVSPPPPGGWYDDGTVVQVTALADTANDFVWTDWGGDLAAETNDTVSVTIDTSKTAIANFHAEILITIQTSPLGRTYLVDDTVYTSTHTFNWLEGQQHTISVADSIQPNGTGVRYAFSDWSDSGTRSHVYTVPYTNQTVTANFNIQYEVTLNVSPGTATGPGWHNAGTTVSCYLDSETVIVEAGKRYRFDGWTGVYSDSGASFTIPSISAPFTETASWYTQFLLATSEVPVAGGDVTPAPPGAWYDSSTVATVSAAVAAGYQFTGWEGDLSGTDTPQNLSMTRARTATGNFAKEVQITVNTSPSGRTIRIDGETISKDTTYTWLEGSGHTLSIVDSIQNGTSGIRYAFSSWSDGGSRNHTYTVPGTNTTVTADFLTQYQLDLVTDYGSPAGAGWYTANTQALFSIDSVVTSGTTRYIFENWSGDFSGSDTSGTLLMNGPKTVSLVWQTQYYLDVVSLYGNITGAGWYDAGVTAEFTLDAQTVAGTTGVRYDFRGWTGTGTDSYSGTDLSHTVIMNGPVLEEAAWQTQYYLTTAEDPDEAGDITPAPPGAWYDDGTSVEVSAQPTPGDTFFGFTGDLSGQTTPQNLVMNGPKSVTANFEDFIQITITTASTGARFRADGIEYTTPYTFAWEEGSQHLLSVDLLQTVNNNTKYSYVSWSDGGDRTHSYTVPSIDAQISINFTAEYLLTIQTNHGTPDGAGWYTGNTLAQFSIDSVVTAGTTRYTFQNWSGDYSGGDTLGTLLMNEPKTVTPVWQTEYYLTVNSPHDDPLGQGWYPAGSTANFSVTDPFEAGGGVRYVLTETGWVGSGTGSYTGSVADTSVVMNNAVMETATWDKQYKLTINRIPEAGGTVTLNPPGDPPGGWYDEGSPVELTAVPTSGFSWSGWSGDLEGTDDQPTITMNRAKTITANFEGLITITIKTNPEGLNFTVDGNDYDSTTAFSWLQGNSHNLEVVSPQYSGDTTRYVFTSWSDGGAQSHSYTVGSTDVIITANFKKQYRLNVNSGHGNPYGAGWYDSGTTKNFGISSTLVYNSEREQYIFDSWASGDPNGYSGSDSTSSVILHNGITETAVWDTLYKISYAAVPTGKGSVSASSAKEWFDRGESVQLTAVLIDSSYQFKDWSGDTTAASASLTLSMKKPYSVQANFELVTHTLTRIVRFIDPSGTVFADSGGTIITTPELDTYPHRSNIVFKAVPQSGMKFIGWSGALTGMTIEQNLYFMSDTTVTATFVLSDNTPPAITGAFPASGSQQVPVNSSVVLNVADDVYGVERSSLDLIVAGQQIINDGDAASSEVTIRSITRGYQIIYTPAAPFDTSATVLVTVSCRDRANPANALVSSSYSFTTGRGSVTSLYSGFIPPAGLVITLTSGLRLTIPAGVVADSSYLSIGQLNVIPALPDSAGHNLLGLVYYFGPEGMTFSGPVTIRLPFPVSDLDRLGIRTTDVIRIYSYSSLTGSWEEISDVEIDLINGYITFSVTHFSIFCITAWTPDISPGQIINYPNPFDPTGGTTTIKYMLPQAGPVSLKVYDVSSSLVAVLEDEGTQKSANVEYAVEWDGRTDSGRIVANNVYFCVLSAQGTVYVRKIVVLR